MTTTPRQRGDFYRTPLWTVTALHTATFPDGGRVLDLRTFPVIFDPACGDGALLEASKGLAPASIRLGLERNGARARQAARWGQVVTGDALREPWRPFRLILMNPPYKLALAFWSKAVRLAEASGGTVAALLREGFAHGAARLAFHQAHPFDLVLLSSRPGFGYGGMRKSKKGGTDSSEYAWFVAGPGRGGRFALAGKEEP